MTKLEYLTDSYKTKLTAHIISLQKKGNVWELVLDQTIFYPQGGGQPSDKGLIQGQNGKAHVKHIRMQSDNAVHECTIDGTLQIGDEVECSIDWNLRFHNMRVHSAGHIVHEAVMSTTSELSPIKGEHGKEAYIEYKGFIPLDKKQSIQYTSNQIVKNNLIVTTEFVSLEELTKRSSYVPEHLPKHKPLRIVQIQGYQAIPDGGTQVKKTGEVGEIEITKIENLEKSVRVHYQIENVQDENISSKNESAEKITAPNFIGMLLAAQQDALEIIGSSDKPIDLLKIEILGGKSEFARLTGNIKLVSREERAQVGTVINDIKQKIIEAINRKSTINGNQSLTKGFDPTMPGIPPTVGHLHIVSQAIEEITRIFERISFTRVRHPEVDWDWYPFESLNMPQNHPARDEWETFFIEYPGKPSRDPHKQKIVLTPHTSNGQVREMEKKVLPIRMINIAKCYRRQTDVSHVPMFHQFEGLYIDQNVSIAHLKGVLTYFFKQFYGPDRKVRLRPFHFQFTEPSFEIDVSCGVCHGTGKLPSGEPCKLCKEGWLELGGAGMVHPVVLANGGIDTIKYNGFAFGWGIERTYMMKGGTQLDDIRLLYSNDVRFLEQF